MKSNLVEHHTKYEEIHGVDETVWMTRGEHIKLHRRLRQTGKCNIPVKELKIISNRAGNRTGKRKEQNRLNKQTKQYKDGQKEYMKEWREENKNDQKEYRKNITRKSIISNTITPGVSLRCDIIYNKYTGNIFIISRFAGNNRIKLITKEI